MSPAALNLDSYSSLEGLPATSGNLAAWPMSKTNLAAFADGIGISICIYMRQRERERESARDMYIYIYTCIYNMYVLVCTYPGTRMFNFLFTMGFARSKPQVCSCMFGLSQFLHVASC